VFAAAQLILGILEKWMNSTGNNKENTNDNGGARHLIEVSPVRSRVLCPHSDCLGENDQRYRYCQWCARPGTSLIRSISDAPMSVDEAAIAKRYKEFRDTTAAAASQKSRCATTRKYNRFLQSRKTGRVVTVEESQPRDITEYLCFLDSCGQNRRR